MLRPILLRLACRAHVAASAAVQTYDSLPPCGGWNLRVALALRHREDATAARLASLIAC